MNNNQSVLDTRKLMTGKDGRVFVELDGENIFYAEVETFQLVMNVTNTDVQPVGSNLQYAVNTGVSYSVNVSEMVVRDDLILGPLQDKIAEGKMPTYTFQGGADRWDGGEQRVTIRNCTPDGQIDLLNLQPGEVIKRNMAFRVNSHPDWLKKLSYESE